NTEPAFEQEFGYFSVAVFAGPEEAVFHLRHGRACLQRSVCIEETLDDIEMPDACRALQIQSRPAARKKLGRKPAAVMKRGDERIPSARQSVRRRPSLEQRIEERNLHSRPRGMYAGRYQSQRGSAPAVISIVGVYLCAGTQQDTGDFHGLLGRLLAKILNAVGADVVKQRRLMRARRARSDQTRIFAQQPREGRNITLDNRIRRGLEVGDGRILPDNRLDVLLELRPAFKRVLARDYKLRAGQRYFSGLKFEPFEAPDRFGIAGLAGLQEILRLLFVLVQAGMGG